MRREEYHWTMKLGWVFACAAVACLGLGCSDDVSGGGTDLVGPKSVRFVQPSGEDGPTCVSIGQQADARVPLLVAVEGLTLKPPGGCGDLNNCGHLIVRADGAENSVTSSKSIELLLGRLGNPYHDGSIHAGTGEPDVLRVSVDIVDDDGAQTFVDDDDVPPSDAVDLITVVECP